MSRIARCAVLLVVSVSLAGVWSSTAGAVTWHNSGDTTFSAATNSFPLASTGAGLACLGSTATGTVSGSPFVGATWKAIHGTLTSSGCVLGVPNWTVDCTYDFTASGAIGSPQAITGDLDMTCGFFIVGTEFCHVTGTAAAVYTNPVPTSIPGKLTITTGGNLIATNGPAGSCPLGSNDKTHLAALNYNISAATGGPTPHLGPNITRTA